MTKSDPVAPLRVGVAGVGALGRHHVRAASGSPALTLVGAYDPRPERARWAEELGGRVFSSLESLLDDCDAVIVASPTSTHREIAGRVIAAGTPCLVEKPLAASRAECDELIALAERAGVVLHVGHVERFNPAVRAASPHLERPRFIETHRLARFTPRGSDVDVLLDLMIHDLDLVLAWTGAEPESVAAVGVPVLTESEDIANARLEFPGGCVADLTASRVSEERMRKIRVFQADAYLSLDCAERTAEIVRADRARLAALVAEVRARAAADPEREHADPVQAAAGVGEAMAALVARRALPCPEGDPLTLEQESFAAACRGVPPPEGCVPADGRAGARAVAVAERVREALRERAARWTRG